MTKTIKVSDEIHKRLLRIGDRSWTMEDAIGLILTEYEKKQNKGVKK